MRASDESGIERILMVMAHPDWKAVASNALIPHFVGSKAFLLMAVALVGTTITPYMQLYQSAAVADSGADPEDYPRVRTDAVGGASGPDRPRRSRSTPVGRGPSRPSRIASTARGATA